MAKLQQNYLLIDLKFMSPEENMLETALTVNIFLPQQVVKKESKSYKHRKEED